MSETKLKRLQECDATSLFLLVDANRPQLKKFIWEVETRSPADSEYYIRTANHKEDVNGAPTRGICVQEQLIGVATLHTIDWASRSSSLGYWIDAKREGHGYATEAARQLVVLAFESIELEQLTASVDVTNVPSMAVLERVGFSRMGTDRRPTWRRNADDSVEVAHYAMTSTDYAT